MKCDKDVGPIDRVKMLLHDDVSNTEIYDILGLPLQGIRRDGGANWKIKPFSVYVPPLFSVFFFISLIQ